MAPIDSAPCEALSPKPARRFPFLAAGLIGTTVIACAIYANLSYAVTNKANYRYFPPFQPNVDRNMNDHLGGEYFNMAKALTAGQGFSDPFDQPTGPTAWQPPILPLFLASLLWVSDGDHHFVTAVVVILQVWVLIGTGVLILALLRQTNTRVWSGVAALVFLLGLVSNFWLCFQYTHDGWLVLLSVDLLIAGFCRCRPLQGWKTAAAWGLFGGLCAMINPGVALAWGLLTVLLALRRCAWCRLAVALLLAALTLTPWTVRNYLVFGRFVPVKSNLFYEMYQTHCLQSEALLQASTFRFHPYRATRRERQEYNALGEAAFLERKRQQLWEAIVADPLNFFDRVANRFLGATLWYTSFQRDERVRRPWVFLMTRLIHPLPFLALLVLVFSAFWRRLAEIQWIAIGIYFLYLVPYVGASYYERYALPLLGLKVLLVLWAVDRFLLLCVDSLLVVADADGRNAITIATEQGDSPGIITIVAWIGVD
jgi:hypothetical protein